MIVERVKGLVELNDHGQGRVFSFNFIKWIFDSLMNFEVEIDHSKFIRDRPLLFGSCSTICRGYARKAIEGFLNEHALFDFYLIILLDF